MYIYILIILSIYKVYISIYILRVYKTKNPS